MSGQVKEASAQHQVSRHSCDSEDSVEGRVCPQGYKQTEVGVIPEDWDVIDLESITTKVGSGKTPKGGSSVYISHGRPLVRSQNVGWGKLLLNDVAYISEEIHETFLGSELREGDVLLNITGASIGRSSVASDVLSGGNVNQHVCIIRVDTNKVDSRVICSLILSSEGQAQIDSFQAGGNREGLNFTQVKALKFALSRSKKEQTAIANALSDVDALITALEKLIAKKRALKTAAMQQLLTGKKRLSGFEGDWSIISMNTDASLKARIGWQALTTSEYLDQGDFYLVTGTDFKGGRVDWSTCHYVDEWRYSQDRNIQLQNGDVLLTKDGTIGKVGYVDKLDAPATLNSGVFVIRPVKGSFHPLFLFYILSSRIFDNFLNRITAGSTITHLYQKDFVTFEFFAPSKNEQEAISEILSTMDDEIELLQQRLNKTQQLKQGMMQELLTGSTRLI
ncbi:MAG: restriction endonuclease subunit S [Methylococcaceae bacterium]